MKIEEIEGVGPTYAAKLSGAGVLTTEHLLERGGSPSGREALADETGQSHAQILEWVNHVDLMRINGVGSEYADLLEAAGVDSVPELARRNAANLAAATRVDEREQEARPPGSVRDRRRRLDRRGQDAAQARHALAHGRRLREHDLGRLRRRPERRSISAAACTRGSSSGTPTCRCRCACSPGTA